MIARLGPAPRRASARRPPGRRAPLLVLRFAVVSALVVGLAAASILFVVRGLATSQAQRQANETVHLASTAVLRPALRPSDLRRPVVAARRRQLDVAISRRLLMGDLLAVTLQRPDGLITYSTDHRLIGRRQSSDNIRQAGAGALVSDVLSTATGKRLRTFVPIAVGKGQPAVARVDQNYAPVADAARAVFFPIAAVLEGVLVLLFILFVPLLRRTSLRIQAQMDEIEHASRHDDLTGLPNRVRFQEVVETALLSAKGRTPGPAVLVLDVNDFKEINDTLGHETGDDLLRAIGERLQSALPATRTLARLGGDEFAVLLPHASEADVVSTAEGVLAEFSEPFVVRDVPLAVEASVGIAHAPHHGSDPGALLKHADVAMYEAKTVRSGYAIYDVRSDRNDAGRLQLFADFRRALSNGELSVHYQPKASLADNSIVGVEALVRWNHPERGLVPADEFVPLAERTGLMKPMTRHVFQIAVAQAQAWEELGLDLRLAVNLSAADLLDESVPAELVGVAREAGVDLRNLEVEVTESAAMVDPARTRDVLLAFSRAGLTVAIDDFGTGYSSLAYLRSLPVSVLKIDKSFVQQISVSDDDATIVRSTIELGRSLGLSVVAEGVETAEHWEDLRAYGCHEAQGYLIGAPMPADELTAWLTGLDGCPGEVSEGGLKAA